jgi:hypothetical protein
VSFLRWSLKPAAKESEWLRQISKEKGIKPKILKDQPTLFPDVIWLWNGFELLSQTRDYGFGGPMRIRAADIKAWMDMRGITRDDDVDFALRMIPLLDSIWCAEHYQEQDKKRPSKGKR